MWITGPAIVQLTNLLTIFPLPHEKYLHPIRLGNLYAETICLANSSKLNITENRARGWVTRHMPQELHTVGDWVSMLVNTMLCFNNRYLHRYPRAASFMRSTNWAAYLATSVDVANSFTCTLLNRVAGYYRCTYFRLRTSGESTLP